MKFVPLEIHMAARCDNDIDGHLAVQMGASGDSSIYDPKKSI